MFAAKDIDRGGFGLCSQKWQVVFNKIRYGVVANIAVSHTAAGGSIPPIGDFFSFFVLPCCLSCFPCCIYLWMIYPSGLSVCVLLMFFHFGTAHPSK